MRLIDADALAKFIDYGHLNNPNEKLYSENDIREMIDMMPTVDAVPVKHGKWEMVPDPFGFFDVIPVCTECGCTTKMREKTKFCPHCGARMDEE